MRKACLWHKLSEELSDLVWCDFDKWNKKVQNTVGYQIIRASDSPAGEKLGPKLNAFINSLPVRTPVCRPGTGRSRQAQKYDNTNF